MLSYKIVVSTLSTARTLALMEVPKGHFTHILIDEAAQVLMKGNRAVFWSIIALPAKIIIHETGKGCRCMIKI